MVGAKRRFALPKLTQLFQSPSIEAVLHAKDAPLEKRVISEPLSSWLFQDDSIKVMQGGIHVRTIRRSIVDDIKEIMAAEVCAEHHLDGRLSIFDQLINCRSDYLIESNRAVKLLKISSSNCCDAFSRSTT